MLSDHAWFVISLMVQEMLKGMETRIISSAPPASSSPSKVWHFHHGRQSAWNSSGYTGNINEREAKGKQRGNAATNAGRRG
jgi:hypothetical protein